MALYIEELYIYEHQLFSFSWLSLIVFPLNVTSCQFNCYDNITILALIFWNVFAWWICVDFGTRHSICKNVSRPKGTAHWITAVYWVRIMYLFKSFISAHNIASIFTSSVSDVGSIQTKLVPVPSGTQQEPSLHSNFIKCIIQNDEGRFSYCISVTTLIHKNTLMYYILVLLTKC